MLIVSTQFILNEFTKRNMMKKKIKCKTLLVAKDFTQKHDTDFDKTFLLLSNIQLLELLLPRQLIIKPKYLKYMIKKRLYMVNSIMKSYRYINHNVNLITLALKIQIS